MYEYYITPEEYEVAERNGISRNTLETRIRQSAWRKKEALTKTPQGQCDEYKKYSKLAEENGIKGSTFRMRLKRGWSLEDAATKKTMSRIEIAKVAHEKKGRKFTDAQLEKARSLGISNQRLYARTELLGWSKDEAVNIPLVPQDVALRRARDASPFHVLNEMFWNERRARALNKNDY